MLRTMMFVILAGSAVGSLGCQKSAQAEGHPGESTKTTLNNAPAPPLTPAKESAPASAQVPEAKPEERPIVELEIASVGDTMAFDKTKLTVANGSKVHLVLKNRGTLAVMTHNWVLVKKGTEARVALDGLEKAATTGYVVPGENVLAYTPMAAPGGSTEVTFDAPSPGTYPYICTFPGHYVVMKGELTVTP
jgi:azurin